MMNLIQRREVCIAISLISLAACGTEPSIEHATVTEPLLNTAQDAEAYFANRYAQSDVVHSFTTTAGDEVDCIPFEAQPYFRSRGIQPRDVVKPVPPPIPPRKERTRGKRMTSELAYGIGTIDGKGRMRDCPDGTVSMLHVKPEVVRGRRLADVFAKSQNASVGGQPPQLGATDHYQYALGVQSTTSYGAYGSFDVWNPAIVQGDHSLTQLWSSHQIGSTTRKQTVEVGWNVDYGLYGDYQTHFFIFSTNDGYVTNGCYNNMCGDFVQNGGPICLGCAMSNVGSNGTDPYYEDFAAQSWSGEWWIYRSSLGYWIGFYPAAKYSNVNPGLGQSADRMDVGGEIYQNSTSPHTGTDMGSGQFAAAGYNAADLITDLAFYDVNHNSHAMMYSTTTPAGTNTITDSNCYSLANTSSGGISEMYVGGPGYAPNCQ